MCFLEPHLISTTSDTNSNDIHATILHLLGLEHKQTDFMHNGRMERPTILGEGKINELIS